MSINQEDIARVFEMQQKRHPRERLSKDKAKLIRDRLKEGYTVEDLHNAILGCHHTPHNLGENDRRTKYLGLHVSIHSKNVVRFIEVGEAIEAQRLDIHAQALAKQNKRMESKRLAEARDLTPAERDAELAEFRELLKKELGR